MNVIKVTLGFLELAFALKFLSVADLAYGWRILDRETFLALWIVIFGLMGLYLLGKIKFPHDGDENRVGVGRFFPNRYNPISPKITIHNARKVSLSRILQP